MASTSAVRNWVEADHGVANGCGFGHAVAEMADEQHVQIGKIVFLDHEIIFRGQKRRAVDAFGLQQRRRLRLFGRAEFLSAHRHKAGAQPFADRLRHLGHAHGAIGIGRRAHLVGPAYARLPALVDELLCGGGERVRYRIPDVDPAVAVEIDAVLVEFRRQELREPGGAGPGRAQILARHPPSPIIFSARMNSVRY